MAETVTLSRAHGEAAATLTATLLTAVGDAYFQKESLAVGDAVRLLDDGGRECFLGAVQAIRRDGERAKLVACDRGLYLTQNQLHGVFAGSGAEIVRAVGKQLGLNVGKVEALGGYRCVTAGVGESAFALLRRVVGDEAEISLADGSLTVCRPSGTVYALPPEQVLAVHGTADLRDTVNRCVVVDRRGSVAATAENRAEMTAYGQRQRVCRQQGDDPKAQAREALVPRQMTGSVTLWGNLNYTCGCTVALRRPDWGVDGRFRVTAYQHRWQAGQFTTTLTLEGMA